MRTNGMTSIRVEVSLGEVIDKITILEIKSERITDAAKLSHVRAELDHLRYEWTSAVPPSGTLNGLVRDLKKVNEQLWEIEDAIRLCEQRSDFGVRFVELARLIHFKNDERAALKKQVNQVLGSSFIEEKSYAA